MSTISFALVLEAAFRSTSSTWPPSEEAVASLSELSLSGRGVAHIDNLEPFFDLRSLDLSRNAIQTVDNLYFLVKLEDLDLSYNRIADIDSLTRANFPRNLRRLRLDGNPFCRDERAVQEVATRLGPGVTVSALPPSDDDAEEEGERGEVKTGAIDKSSGGKPSVSLLDDGHAGNIMDINKMVLNEGEDHEGDDEEEEEGDVYMPDDEVEEPAPVPPVHYDADALLREIVDRKCMIQSLSRVDVNQLVEILTAETDEISSRHARRVVERASASAHASAVGVEPESPGGTAVDVAPRPKSRHRTYEESVDHVDRLRRALLSGGAAEAERDRVFLQRLRGQAGVAVRTTADLNTENTSNNTSAK